MYDDIFILAICEADCTANIPRLQSLKGPLQEAMRGKIEAYIPHFMWIVYFWNAGGGDLIEV